MPNSNLRRMMMMAMHSAGDAPAGCTPLEYLESTGTQYIDTGILGSNKNGREVKSESCVLYSRTNADWVALGARDMHLVNGRFNMIGVNNGRFSLGIGAWHPFGSVPQGIKQASVISVSSDKVISYLDDILTDEWRVDKVDSKLPMYIFASNVNGVAKYNAQARMYYLKLYENNVLVRDYRPYLRASDNKPGMYDFVSKRFFVNEGSGEFLYG